MLWYKTIVDIVVYILMFPFSHHHCDQQQDQQQPHCCFGCLETCLDLPSNTTTHRIPSMSIETSIWNKECLEWSRRCVFVVREFWFIFSSGKLGSFGCHHVTFWLYDFTDTSIWDVKRYWWSKSGWIGLEGNLLWSSIEVFQKLHENLASWVHLTITM